MDSGKFCTSAEGSLGLSVARLHSTPPPVNRFAYGATTMPMTEYAYLLTSVRPTAGLCSKIYKKTWPLPSNDLLYETIMNPDNSGFEIRFMHDLIYSLANHLRISLLAQGCC